MQRLSFAAFLAIFLPLAGLADTSQISGICPGLDVTATAPEAGLHDLICRTATDHVARLSACGILPTRRISVTAAPAIEGLPANCVGAFHCERDEIEIISPETLAVREHYIKMAGGEVFKHAVRRMEGSCKECIDAAGISEKEISFAFQFLAP